MDDGLEMFHSLYSGILRHLLGVLLLTATVPAGPALAWGPEGHRVSGLIAEHFLLPEVKRKIRLEFNIKSLADASLWADKVRDVRENGKWHYCNIREKEGSYNKERDCPKGNCVVEKVKDFKKVLTDSDLSPRKRQEALKYLVHFVGDLHQPLHLGNQKDRGGGTLYFMFRGEQATLHYLWDGGFIDFRNIGHYGEGLVRRISEQDRVEWSRSERIDDWANESRGLALKHAYVVGRTDQGLTKEYIRRSREIIEMRLSQSGFRLARMLNTLLKPEKEGTP